MDVSGKHLLQHNSTLGSVVLLAMFFKLPFSREQVLISKSQQPSIIKFEVSETNTSGGAWTVVSVWCQLSISARLVLTRVHFQLEYTFNTIYTRVQYIISLIIHILLSLLYICHSTIQSISATVCNLHPTVQPNCSKRVKFCNI